MFRASHRSSDGFGLDPRLGLRNRFSEANLSLTNIQRTSVIAGNVDEIDNDYETGNDNNKIMKTMTTNKVYDSNNQRQ